MNSGSLVALAMAASVALAGTAPAEPVTEVVPRSELEFIPLNPARGDAAPQAGGLWGDIRKDVPSGVLLKFAPGFSSPPHIHNITYRAVVIDGALYNGDENAAKMWMGPGSFWNQPAGQLHITAASEDVGATAFLEILDGPYLVQPPSLAFNNDERPVNLDAGNVFWLDASDVTWVDMGGASSAAAGTRIAFLWGSPENGEKNGTLLRLPAGLGGELADNGSWLRAVVIQGQIGHRLADSSEATALEPGSYFGSHGKAVHHIACEAEDACLLYVRTDGRYEITEVPL